MGAHQKIRREVEPDLLCVCNSIPITKGQSQQKYRFCENYVKANARIRKPVAHLLNTHAIVDEMQGCTYMSAVDIRPGFQNVKVLKEY